MRVRGKTTAFCQLLSKMMEVLCIDSPLQIGTCIISGRRVALEVDYVTLRLSSMGTKEMVEPHFVKRRARCIGRNVPSDTIVNSVGFYHHSQSVPADVALDLPFDFTISRISGLTFSRHRIEIGRVNNGRQREARFK